jgi:predicted kinase
MQKETAGNQAVIVIINGLPGTGKTTIGSQIAKELCFPFINKDGIKETLFDSLGWSDREWSRKLSQATYDLMFHILERLLTENVSLVVESNFKAARHRESFLQLFNIHRFYPVEVVCITDGVNLWQRFQDRMRAGERHPGHVDKATLNELKTELLSGRAPALNLPGMRIEIDTTNFEAVVVGDIVARIRKEMKGMKSKV